MADNWLTEFGFKKSPYDARALSSEEGDKLLVGREDETDWLTQQLTSTSRAVILEGNNGVGKSSIANVVAYRLCKEYMDSDQQYFFLESYQVQKTDLTDLKAFEKKLYYEIILILLKQKSFLKKRGISVFEFLVTWLASHVMLIGFGVGVANIEVSRNASAEPFINRIAKKWLKKCFSDPYGGGIICVIDNLENYGTAGNVQEIIENMRDTLFAVTGLRWILCGTADVVSGTSTSSRLTGYLSNRPIEPIDEDAALELVRRRIQYFGTENAKPPVDSELFQFIYRRVVNSQLRIALMLCEEFAMHLYNNPERREEDRKNEFTLWLNQKIAELTDIDDGITQESWEFFDLITDLGTDFYSARYGMYSLQNEDEIDALALPLKNNKLLLRIDTDDGYLLRVTKNGWLVNYQRKNS